MGYKIKHLHALSSQFAELSGPRYTSALKGNLKGRQPLFIFDFFVCTRRLRIHISEHALKQSGLVPHSLDIVYVDGQSDVLNDGTLSFWFWDKNGLIPFAFVGCDAHQGPFSDYTGVLFLKLDKKKIKNTDINDYQIALYDVEKGNISLTAKNIADLAIEPTTPDREESERLKSEGNEMYGDGKPDIAYTRYYESMLADPENPNPYNNIATINSMLKRDENFSEFFLQLSLLKDPEDDNTLRGISSTLLMQNDKKVAVHAVKRALEVERSPHNLMVATRISFVSGKLKFSRKCCEEALELVPDDEEFLELKEKIDKEEKEKE